jgi:hypothetical protein
LLIGFIGGEFEVSAAKIPRVGKPGRIGSVAVGVVCLTLALQSMMADRARTNAQPSAQLQQSAVAPAAVAPAPEASPRPATEDCKPGFVWREARASDLVCVTPSTRARTAEENLAADAHRVPGGPYHPNTCETGYVWREAFEGDVVCVIPESRAEALADNSQSVNRKAQ